MEPFTGLTPGEAAARAMEDTPQHPTVNRDPKSHTKSVGRILCENALTVFNLVNLVLAICVISVGAPIKNILFMGIVLMNLAIGVVQELRARAVVEKLTLLADAPVRVLRGGVETPLPRTEIVLGDTLRLHTGERVPCDCRILDGACEADASALTGESVPETPDVGEMLWAGSFLTSGSVYAEATGVGSACRMAAIAASAKESKLAPSEIMRTLNRVISVLAAAIIPVGAVLMWQQLRLQDFSLAVVNVTAALIGMIPEGLMLLTSTVFAVGVIRLSKYRVLVRELASIESLARVNLLCLDKTGTITSGEMEFSTLIPMTDAEDAARALRMLTFALDDDSATFSAIRRWGIRRERTPCELYPATVKMPFSSRPKRSGAAFGDVAYVLGAPEWLMPHLDITPYYENGQLRPDARVLLLVRCAHLPDGDAPVEHPVPVALVALRDQVRETAKETFSFFLREGVGLRVISGDNPVTVSQVAARAGIPHAERYIDASTLESRSDVLAAAERYTVFGRVTPERKRELVEAFRLLGFTTAMTGDGVNDVPALREADCGIAMASGTDAARAVAKLVLLDSNFDALPKVVAEGRRCINNLQRSASLFLVKTMYATVFAVLFALVPWAYPFVPIQLTLVSTTTIGIPSFLLALGPNRERVSGRFLENVLRRSLPGAVSAVVTVTAAQLLGTSLTPAQLSSVCVLCLGLAGIATILRTCMPFDRVRAAIFIGMTAAFCAGYFGFPDFFELCAVPPAWYLAAVLATAAVFTLTDRAVFLIHRAFARTGEK